MFVHVSTLQQGGSLREGDNVTFEVGQDRKTGRSKAENVNVLSSADLEASLTEKTASWHRSRQNLLKIPTFHLQRIDVQIPHEYVPRLGQWFLSIARVPTTRRAMSELVSSS